MSLKLLSLIGRENTAFHRKFWGRYVVNEKAQAHFHCCILLYEYYRTEVFLLKPLCLLAVRFPALWTCTSWLYHPSAILVFSWAWLGFFPFPADYVGYDHHMWQEGRAMSCAHGRMSCWVLPKMFLTFWGLLTPPQHHLNTQQNSMNFKSIGAPDFAWWLFGAPKQKETFVHCVYWASKLGIWSLSTDEAQSLNKVWSWRQSLMYGKCDQLNTSEKCLEKGHQCNTEMAHC